MSLLHCWLVNSGRLRILEMRELAGRVQPAIVALVVGVVAGVSVALYSLVFEWISTLFGSMLGYSRLLALLLVPAGMLASYAVVVAFTSDKKAGCGTHAFLEQYHILDGEAGLKDTAARAAASAMTIGMGGSAGLEGPSLAIGGGVGSFIARAVKLPREGVRKIFLAGGPQGSRRFLRLRSPVFSSRWRYLIGGT